MVSVSMVSSVLENIFPRPFPPSVWVLVSNVLYLTIFPILTIIRLMDVPHCIMGTLIVCFIVNFLCFGFPFLWIPEFPLILWTHFPLFATLTPSFGILYLCFLTLIDSFLISLPWKLSWCIFTHWGHHILTFSQILSLPQSAIIRVTRNSTLQR